MARAVVERAGADDDLGPRWQQLQLRQQGIAVADLDVLDGPARQHRQRAVQAQGDMQRAIGAEVADPRGVHRQHGALTGRVDGMKAPVPHEALGDARRHLLLDDAVLGSLALRVGNPALRDTEAGLMNSGLARTRAKAAVDGALHHDATRLCGNTLHGALCTPTPLEDARFDSKLWCDEVLGPPSCYPGSTARRRPWRGPILRPTV
jgi:hypothetical protein